MLISSLGRAVRFKLSDIRRVGRIALGVKGIRLEDQDYVMNCLYLAPDTTSRICVVTSNGKGRLVPLNLYPIRNRGAKGVHLFTLAKRSHIRVICALAIDKDRINDAELLTSTSKGLINRIAVKSVPVHQTRMTLGVNIINLHKNDNLVSANLILKNNK